MLVTPVVYSLAWLLLDADYTRGLGGLLPRRCQLHAGLFRLHQ